MNDDDLRRLGFRPLGISDEALGRVPEPTDIPIIPPPEYRTAVEGEEIWVTNRTPARSPAAAGRRTTRSAQGVLPGCVPGMQRRPITAPDAVRHRSGPRPVGGRTPHHRAHRQRSTGDPTMTEPTPDLTNATPAEVTAAVGMSGDTAPDNPVNAMPENVFPIGAALTIAYGSPERYFATIGNVYRILGYLTGNVPGVEDLADAMSRCQVHVETQLPTDMRIIDPPPVAHDGDDTGDIAWVAGIVNKYGPTIRLEPLPDAGPPPATDIPEPATDDSEGPDDDQPA